MQANKESGRTRRRIGGARAVVFFFWVVLIFSHISISGATMSQARKTRFLHTTKTTTATVSSFRAPVSPAPSPGINGDPNSSTLYGQDKRVVHTGPNPLHN